MWKNYSADFIKKNGASSISVLAAAFISALFLSLLGSLFYNFWIDEINRIELQEGAWQARLNWEFSEKELEKIRQFANVEQAERNRELSEEQGMTVDLYFKNPRTIFSDVPLILEQLEIPEEAAVYHETWLSRYLIHHPEDQNPPLLMSFYLAVLLIVALSLILIIYHSFSVSMNERLRQFGIFSSIGATPAQIRLCLMQEAAALTILPIVLGVIAGTAGSAGLVHAMGRVSENLAGARPVSFQFHMGIFLGSLGLSLATVWFSAWIPARKLGKLTPLEAIRNTGEFTLKRKKESRWLSFFFGIEGELAGNSLKSRKKAMRTTSLSLTLSFVGFMMMLCFFKLSGISTEETYFARYKNAWDVMITVKNTALEEVSSEKELRNLGDTVIYQKAEGTVRVPKEWQSEELKAVGGASAVGTSVVIDEGESYLVKGPMIILDDQSFLSYLEKLQMKKSLSGTIVLNQIWDSLHSNFRQKKWLPFVKEDRGNLKLIGEEEREIPVLGYTTEPPLLREEYANYSLVQFVPESLWKSLKKVVPDVEKDSYIRILSEEEEPEMETLCQIEERAVSLLGNGLKTESENRIEEKQINDKMILGYQTVLGSFCILLAVIGIANVFSNTMGFLRQRRQEFARYQSVGMTPGSMKKVFLIEALVIAGKPFLLTIPLTGLFTAFAVSASHLEWKRFVREMPIGPGILFALAVFGFVGLAYYLGGKKILKSNLAEALRDDTMNLSV